MSSSGYGESLGQGLRQKRCSCQGGVCFWSRELVVGFAGLVHVGLWEFRGGSDRARRLQELFSLFSKIYACANERCCYFRKVLLV